MDNPKKKNKSSEKKKYPWLYQNCIVPYQEHKCINPSWEPTKQHIEWRAKEAALWAGKSVLKLNNIRKKIDAVEDKEEFAACYGEAIAELVPQSAKRFDSFVRLLSKFTGKDNKLTVYEVMRQVAMLFIGHDGLIIGFELFLPKGLTMIVLLVQQKAAAGAAIASDPLCVGRLPDLHDHIGKAGCRSFDDLEKAQANILATPSMQYIATANPAQPQQAQQLNGQLNGGLQMSATISPQINNQLNPGLLQNQQILFKQVTDPATGQIVLAPVVTNLANAGFFQNGSIQYVVSNGMPNQQQQVFDPTAIPNFQNGQSFNYPRRQE